MTVAAADTAAIAAQLGRRPRALHAVAHRCGCGLPDVVQTRPRLEDGTPFPTLFYLTCPRAAAAVSRLEAGGVMAQLTSRLAQDPALAASYRRAHESYLAERDALEPLGTTVTAGGMPERVKCLHVLVAHELARPGHNPLGREALDALPAWQAASEAQWGAVGPCVPAAHDVA